MNLAHCRHSSKLRFPLYSFSLSSLLQTSTANRHAVTTVLATQLHAVLPIFQFGQSQLGQHKGSDSSLVPYLVLLHVNIVRTDFTQLCPCHLHDADGPAPCEQKRKKSQKWPWSLPGGKSLPWSPGHPPFIVAEVFVCKLLEEGPFHHLLWSVVLQEVDEHVLQAGIILGGWGLFGKQVQPGVLLMERLPMEHRY